jgi:hypothetical protein
MRRSRQMRSARDNELKSRDAVIRVFGCDQEADREWPETDGLTRRIDADVDCSL